MDTRETGSPSTSRSFEERFRRAARRVLRRRGVPADRIEAEIARLRSLDFDLPVPTMDELEADARHDHREG